MMIFRNSSIKNERILGNLNTFIELTPLKGLTIKGAQAFEGYIYKYRGVNYPWEDNEFNGNVSEQFQRASNWTFTNTVEYKHTFAKKHFMTLLAGQESIIHNADGFSASGKGIEDKRLTQLSAISASSAKVDGARSEYSIPTFSVENITMTKDTIWTLHSVEMALHVSVKTIVGLLSSLLEPCIILKTKLSLRTQNG